MKTEVNRRSVLGPAARVGGLVAVAVLGVAPGHAQEAPEGTLFERVAALHLTQAHYNRALREIETFGGEAVLRSPDFTSELAAFLAAERDQIALSEAIALIEALRLEGMTASLRAVLAREDVPFGTQAQAVRVLEELEPQSGTASSWVENATEAGIERLNTAERQQVLDLLPLMRPEDGLRLASRIRSWAESRMREIGTRDPAALGELGGVGHVASAAGRHQLEIERSQGILRDARDRAESWLRELQEDYGDPTRTARALQSIRREGLSSEVIVQARAELASLAGNERARTVHVLDDLGERLSAEELAELEAAYPTP